MNCITVKQSSFNADTIINLLNVLNQGVNKNGHLKRDVQRGILMHSSLVVTSEGLSLGLAAIKFWIRKRFKGTNALKKHVNPTGMPIDKKESYRWLENMIQSTKQLNDPQRCVHVGDRESDIYELFCTAKQLKTHFLVRICILPPIGKQKLYHKLWLTVIHAMEQSAPTNREKIHWKLLTHLNVSSCQGAIEKLHWYDKRWHIETFHKILKSGCQAESSKLRSANRLTKLLSIFCIIGWRIFWITILNRLSKNSSPFLALTTV